MYVSLKNRCAEVPCGEKMPDKKILQTRLKQDEKGTIQKHKNHG